MMEALYEDTYLQPDRQNDITLTENDEGGSYTVRLCGLSNNCFAIKADSFQIRQGFLEDRNNSPYMRRADYVIMDFDLRVATIVELKSRNPHWDRVADQLLGAKAVIHYISALLQLFNEVDCGVNDFDYRYVVFCKVRGRKMSRNQGRNNSPRNPMKIYRNGSAVQDYGLMCREFS